MLLTSQTKLGVAVTRRQRLIRKVRSTLPLLLALPFMGLEGLAAADEFSQSNGGITPTNVSATVQTNLGPVAADGPGSPDPGSPDPVSPGDDFPGSDPGVVPTTDPGVDPSDDPGVDPSDDPGVDPGSDPAPIGDVRLSVEYETTDDPDYIRISGSVEGKNATVFLSGVIELEVEVDVNGNFEVTTQLKKGAVEAIAVDENNQSSEVEFLLIF